MGLLGWLFKRRPPAWSGFDEHAAFERFITQLEGALPGNQWRLRSGTATFQSVSGDYGVSIETLSRACAALPEARWPDEIAAFVRTPDPTEQLPRPPRRSARPPKLSVELAPDGSVSIQSGGDLVRLNVPIAAPEPAPLEEPQEIARRVLAERADAELAEFGESVFLDACWLLGSQASAVHPQRAALVRGVTAALAQDVSGCLGALEQLPAGLRAELACALLTPLSADGLEAACLRQELAPRPALVARVATQSPARALALVQLGEEGSRPWLALAAILSAQRAGHEVPAALLAVWEAAGLTAWERRDSGWIGGELERLSGLDVSAAEALFERARGELSLGDESTRVFFEALARAVPARALELIEPPEAAEGFDMMPRVRGCLAAGLPPARDLLDGYVQRLTPFAYRPVALFGMLLDAALFLEDARRVSTIMERAGPNGWQTTLVARSGVTRLARQRSAALPGLLQLLTTRSPPGPVAARDASAGGLIAGSAGFRPAWLTFQHVRAQDTLRLIGPDGPLS